MRLNRIYCDDTNESLSTAKTIKEQKADIEVENPGILEVPEGKNVEDLPIKHFVDIANRKGLSTVTRALNNLQVWNKNKNKSLSKWAGNMIDKVSKRFENQKKNESLYRLNEATLQDWQNIIVEEVYNVLSNNNIHTDVYEDSDSTEDNSFILCVEIDNGDWKHEHKRADLIISNLLDNYDNISVTKMKEEVINDSEDDTYSSIHKYMIIKSNDMTEDCCDEEILNEFSSNYADTEFDEVEFYSNTLRDVPANRIATAIETGCDFDINIYDIEIDTMGTMIISYEVRTEDYNPDVIESTIISILERLEDRMGESFNCRNCNEDYNIDFDAVTIPENERYEYIKSKTVLDSDGWQTDYTMYYDWEDDKYIFIFGDSDIYDPTNESPDWECDTEAEANEWFDNYTGFDDEEDFDECYLSEDNYNTEHKYRVWYRPHGLDGDEEDYIDVTASNEDEAIRFARTCGYTTGAELLESKKLKEGLRYFVTDDDYIPLREQPNEGYTELQAVKRAQREAERSAKLFNLKVSETAKWYHIMDSNHKIRHDLDTAI